MTTQVMLADETVSISEFRKKPQIYFTDHPIAVLSNNRTAGYIVGAEAFEAMLAIIQQSQQGETFPGRFQPSASRMRSITQKAESLLMTRSKKQLQTFTE
ncbi:MAG: type I toxin-antitoxin system antitoxin YafN [Gammaproteobacteria bacterium]|jgi:antitoxin YafN|nr:type I toxin-antitoxin system antitoxin YafN [Gammaproteobacteria bacterium]